MALITDKNVDESGNIIMNIACGVTDTMTLNTANTYSDKNIVLYKVIIKIIGKNRENM